MGCDWCISILTVLARSCSLSGPLLYRFPVVFLDRGHPRFGNFNSAIPVDVIRVKSYVNSFLEPSGVPVRVSINKLYLVPKRVMAGLVGMLTKVESDPTLADRTTLTPAQIVNLLDFVLRSTYFQYNGSIYEQQEGAAMGSPVSAVIVNLYMETFEEQAIESAPFKPKIWKRYVDDTFTILDRDRVDSFLQHLNSRPSASPWKPRMTTRSPFSTRQFQENQTAALPPASTGSQLTPINTLPMIHTILNQ